MLKVRGLYKRFGGLKAVNDCAFEVERGSVVGLIGPNGAGKSTVFNIITGLIDPDAGSVIFENADVTKMKPHVRANMGISRTFQLARVLPKLSVLENMLLAIRNQKESVYHALLRTKAMKKEQEQNKERCLHWLTFVGLEKKADDFASDLSYGQQKLLEIARALVAEPDLLILDEPTAGVNPVLKKKIKALLKDLNEKGMTILLIEHDMSFVMDISKKVVVLDHGKEIAVGTPAQVKKNPKVLEAYLGR